MNKKQEIRLFGAQVFVFLIVFFIIWYYTASWLAVPVIHLLRWLLLHSFEIIKQVDIVTNANGEELLHVFTSTEGVIPSFGDSFTADANFNVDVLQYTYGQVLMCALFFASRLKGWGWRLLLGNLLLIPSQVFGGFFRALLVMTMSYGTTNDGLVIAGYLGLNTLSWNLIIYFYQASILILSPLMPVIIWVFLCRRQLVEKFPFFALLFNKLNSNKH